MVTGQITEIISKSDPTVTVKKAHRTPLICDKIACDSLNKPEVHLIFMKVCTLYAVDIIGTRTVE